MAIDKKLRVQLPCMIININVYQRPFHSSDKYNERDIPVFSTNINEK
jgi:hypothetical protein